MSQPHTDFTSVTEVSGYQVTQDQIDRALTRYSFARGLAAEKDVLEVACGSGQGLGMLAKVAKRVVGIDIDPKLVEIAQQTYANHPKIQILQGDASNIPFPDQSFDLILLFEAIYYLPDIESFIKETRRLLRPGGSLVICSANKDWEEFNPSPFSHRYFSLPEYPALCRDGFVNFTGFGSSPAKEGSIIGSFVGLLKKFAVKFNLMPKTMKGKEIFKRFFMGTLRPFPRELNDTDGKLFDLSPLPLIKACLSYKVIFFQAVRATVP
ncbi:MAG TPA: class I SAM-dependent methyltransferase [Candidatus Ozemobacteraceae bacterium]|nr:class I SAM-dependent methyltransferase [Candidatus Ozemobacteraceae bacterium]